MRWNARSKNKIISIFKNNNQGVMSIEIAIAMLAFFSVIFFTINIGIFIANKSKIERVSYSLSSLFRERSIYDGDDNINLEDVDELAKVGLVMLGDELANGSILMVEGLYFDNKNPNISQDNPILKEPPTQTQIVSILGNQNEDINTIAFECFNKLKTDYPLVNLRDMSIWSIRNRWPTIYRVSLCVPNRSRFSINFVNYVSKLPKKYVITDTVLAR